MAAATVIAFPSRKEPLGNVILEAWAMRRPIVATRSQGADFLIQNNENALLVEADDVDAFAERLAFAIDHPADMADMIANGRAKYEAEFSKAAVIERYLAFFDTLVSPQI